MAATNGESLREWRRVRGWDVPEMARRLRRAAGDDSLPAHDALVRMIRRWERGTYSASERYQLLYASAFGVRPGELCQPPVLSGRPGADRPPALGSRQDGAVIASIASALHTAPAGGCQRERAELERYVRRAWELRQSSEYGALGDLLTGLLADTGSRQADPAPAVHVYNMASSLLKRLGAYETAAVAADRAFRTASQSGSGLLTRRHSFASPTYTWPRHATRRRLPWPSPPPETSR